MNSENQILQEAFYHVTGGLFIVDSEHKICFWNKWLEKKTKIKESEIKGKYLSDFFEGVESTRYKAALNQALINQASQILSHAINKYIIPIEIDSHGKHGISLMQQQAYITPIQQADAKPAAMIQIIDVTENIVRSSALTEVAQKLEEESIKDDLTNIYNRRFMWEWLTNQITQARRTVYPIACILLDIDHFKAINDVHGHQIGDEILKDFAKIVSSTLRESDIIVRYGGEEFAAFLPFSDLSGAYLAAKRVQTALENHTFSQYKKGAVTCSMGLSLWEPIAPKTGECLLREADKQLYRAKNSGRNCIMPNIVPFRVVKQTTTIN